MPHPILDNIEEMRKIDKNNMLGFCTKAAGHYKESAAKVQEIALDYPTPSNIIIAGMGGSAIGGELLKDYVRKTAQIPIEISREYYLPAYAGKNSLVILASYSGDTEETLSSLVDAVNHRSMTFCISSGGNLLKYAKKLNLPFVKVRSGMPPRAALPHMLLPLLTCLRKLGMTPKTFPSDMAEATTVLEKISKENAPGRTIKENFAKSLAENLLRTAPVVYGFGNYRGVALRYKQQFNENAKLPAKWESFSELNHNETMGWEDPEVLSKCFSVIFLRDKSEPTEILTRIETTKQLMEPKLAKMYEVWAQGNSDLAKMLSTILVGDFTSVYLAMLRKVDPTPVNTVAVMKEKIEQNGKKQKILEKLEELSSK